MNSGEMEIKWSPAALARLEAIGDFIAQDAPARAAEFEDRQFESIERLREFPLSGPHALENPAYRQVVLQGYRVIYHLLPHEIEIITIVAPGLDGERALQKALAPKNKKKKKP